MTVWVEGGTSTTTEFRREELEKARALLNDAHLQVTEAESWYLKAQGKATPFGLFHPGVEQVSFKLWKVISFLDKLRFDTIKNLTRLDLAIETYEDSEKKVNAAIKLVRYKYPSAAVLLDLFDESPQLNSDTSEMIARKWPEIAKEIVLLGAKGGTVSSIIDTAEGPIREFVGIGESDVPENTYRAAEYIAQKYLQVKHSPIVVEQSEDMGYREFSGDVSDMVAMSRELDQSSVSTHSAGQVMIAEVEGTGGVKTYVVTLPGTTQLNSLENPFSLTGIAEGMLHGSNHVAKATLESLEAVGAPAGAHVVLNGYSQGGIHAANLAGNAEFRARYDVDQIVTVGAPVGKMEIPADVRALHLEHVDDVVPAADGVRNPATPNRVTAYLSGYANSSDHLELDPMNAHAIENYHLQSKQLTFDDSPGIVEVNAALAGIAGVASVAKVHRLTWKRVSGADGSVAKPQVTRSKTSFRPNVNEDLGVKVGGK